MNGKLSSQISLLGLASLIALSARAQTSSPLQNLEFVSDIFPRLVEDAGSGKVCGPGPYLVHETARVMGRGYRLEIAPLKRAVKMVEQGARDAVVSLSKTPEREKFLRFITPPFFTDSIRVFALKKWPPAWNGTMDSLRSSRIGVMKGWYYSKRFTQLEQDDARYRFDWIPVLDSGFRMLRARRIDVLISNDRIFHHYLAKEKTAVPHDSDIVAMEPPLETRDLFIAFSKKTPAPLVEAFEKTFLKVLQDPDTKQLLASQPLPCPR
ncbi:MAG TPA: transporter substrate-binding domain-containing protein [Oligoflexus sp.]|uniref:substrate-binding periplasmic protein n=1 Tax=Oligoflexus sp. TaxID=1971216 RepID=UPI002D592389|nr:transporter substrate-binding domain-containing protein [Oligoflexus sp.]HYX32194.1 transporter substrate-binding domain-containing protein [Oligoflexus sp.]